MQALSQLAAPASGAATKPTNPQGEVQTQVQALGTSKTSASMKFQRAIQAAQSFSAMFIDELLQETMPNLFGQAMGGQSYQTLFLQSLSQDFAKSGDGMGLLPLLERSLNIPASAVRHFESHIQSIPVNIGDAVPEVSGVIAADSEMFVAKLKPFVEQAGKALGVDPKLIMAQAALETGWGKSVVGNNLFGIKAIPGEPSILAATQEANAQGHLYATQGAFRAYSSLASCLDHYVNLLKSRYPGVVGAGSNAFQFVESLAKGHYATDPDYANKILELANSPALAGLSSTTPP